MISITLDYARKYSKIVLNDLPLSLKQNNLFKDPSLETSIKRKVRILKTYQFPK